MTDERIVKALTKKTEEIFDKARPQMFSHNNPKFTEMFKGTPVENMTINDKEKVSAAVDKVYSERWKSFRDGWINVFGGRDVRLLKKNPAVYLEEYMRDVLRFKEDGLKTGFAESWLKQRFIKELNENR